MKKIGIIILLTAIIMQGFSQKLSAESQDGKKQGITESKDENTSISLGKDLLNIEESDSSLNVRIGNRMTKKPTVQEEEPGLKAIGQVLNSVLIITCLQKKVWYSLIILIT